MENSSRCGYYRHYSTILLQSGPPLRQNYGHIYILTSKYFLALWLREWRKREGGPAKQGQDVTKYGAFDHVWLLEIPLDNSIVLWSAHGPKIPRYFTFSASTKFQFCNLMRLPHRTCKERIWTKQGRTVAKYDTSNQIQPLILPLKKFIALCYPHVSEIPTYLFMNDANSDIVCAN